MNVFVLQVRRVRSFCALAVFIFLQIVIQLLLGGPVLAWPTFDWINPAGGQFKQPAHWLPDGPPGNADLARFLLDGSYIISFNENVSTDQLHIDASGTIVFDLTGHTYAVLGDFPGVYLNGHHRITAGALHSQYVVLDGELQVDQPTLNWQNSDRIYIGYNDNGAFDARQGAQVSTWRTYIGNNANRTGSLVVRDPGTYWACPGGLMIVGANGSGSLTIADQAIVESTGAEIAGEYDAPGTAIVTNRGQWQIPDTFYVGLKDHGILTIDEGGWVNSQWFVIAAQESESSAQIVVRNSGSFTPTLWDIGVDLNLGQLGDASMLIESNSIDHQAVVKIEDSMFISYSPESLSELIVTGPGSHLDVVDPSSGVLVVGAFGPATMTIDNGANVDCRIGELAGGFGSQAQATVKNGGSWVMLSEGYFGLKGPATLNVESGGAIACSGFISIGDFAPAEGEVFVRDLGGDGSTLLNSGGDLFVGNFGQGLLSIESGSQTDHAQVTVGGNFEIARSAGSVGLVQAIGSGSHLQLNSCAIGRGGQGTMELKQSASCSATNVVLAEDPNSVGAIIVNDSTALDVTSITIANSLTVGRRAQATFNVDSPSVISAPKCIIGETITSNGSMTLSGPDVIAGFNQFTEIGQKGFGALTLNNVITTSPVVTAGVFPGSNGSLYVNGGRFTAGSGPLTIGYEGSGTMVASGGALIQCNALPDGLVVAAKPGSSGNVTITDPSTLIDVERQFAIERNGIVTITNHGTLRCRKGVSPTSSAAIIATNEPSVAAMFVSDHGWLDCVDGFVNVGFRNNTNGTMMVSDSGKVTSVGGFVARDPGSVGHITVTGHGSQWSNSATVTVGELGIGTLAVNDAGLVSAPNLIVGVNGKLEGAGGIIASPVLNKKLIAPGNATSATGVLTINDNYSQTSAAKLAIELGGTMPGTGHDQLVVNGDVNISGTLEISTTPGYKPPSGQTYQILLACSGCSLSGTFSQVYPAGVYEIIYNADSIIVKVPGQSLPCDADIAPHNSAGDGLINVDDLIMVINAWGKCSGECPADITADGNVNVDDLLAVINSWGVCP